MKQIRRKSGEMEPVLQILMLLSYAIVGGIVFGIVALGIVIALFGTGMIGEIMTGVPTALSADSFKILLFISTSIGTFLVPALALAWTEKIPVKKFYDFEQTNKFNYLLVFLLILVSLPLMELFIEFNQGMSLPERWKDLEAWMRKAEDDAMKTTYTLLTFRNWWDLPVNLLVVAVAPGIAEEFMFRGGLQRSIGRIVRNPHVAIWGSAIIFSAIHMQFFGFIPRMLLGAVFGYIYLWTKNIWFPIFAHFVNNAYAVLVAWNLSRQNIPLEQENMSYELHWIVYVLSTIATIGILYFIKKRTDNEHRTVGSSLQDG